MLWMPVAYVTTWLVRFVAGALLDNPLGELVRVFRAVAASVGGSLGLFFLFVGHTSIVSCRIPETIGRYLVFLWTYLENASL